ncbi:MAG: sigma-54 dependent transcriptional regulator [Alphaproteobacteria bacterium]|nr:sigma-54 dependent transcriptional regulator [Alphaproteobacteria bacterium]
MPPDPTSRRGTVLLVEDDQVLGAALAHRLEIEGYAVVWVRTLADAEAQVARTAPDVLVCDIRLPDGSGEDLFMRRRLQLFDAPVLFMTAFGEIDQAVRLIRAGADDFLLKPFEVPDLLQRIERMLARRVQPQKDANLGASVAIRRLEASLRRAAQVDSSVLLLGESGVGKEVAARLLHALSPTAKAPFVAVNCSAIPADLMESEIFGHERGAFTGATGRHIGFAERAATGMLLLDEVAELPLSLQPKLLRLLEAREFTRVGGTERLPFRARVVAATNADIQGRARDGRFRDDLLYRLDVIRLEVPPLRARQDDVLLLAQQFLAACTQRFARDLRGFDASAEAALLAHTWPGNVRELRNRVERAAAMADGPWITASDLMPDHSQSRPLADTLPTLAATVAAAERRAIEAALSATGGDVTAAAERLSVGRSTLFDKIRRFGLTKARSTNGEV